MFAERDIRVLEVHEGWAHVATSLNGQRQPVARWLAKGPPRTAATQEGLAGLLEVLTLVSHPNRARRLNDRVLAVDKAEDGASFLEVFEWFRTEGYDEDVCFANTYRVFRGGMVDGGAPFTKDIVYTKGIVANYNFLRSAIAAARPELIRWLFVGQSRARRHPGAGAARARRRGQAAALRAGDVSRPERPGDLARHQHVLEPFEESRRPRALRANVRELLSPHHLGTIVCAWAACWAAAWRRISTTTQPAAAPVAEREL